MGTLVIAGLLAAGSIVPAPPAAPRESITAAANRLAGEMALDSRTAPQSRSKSDWNRVRDLETGSRVRVMLRSSVFKEGRLDAVEDDRITLVGSSNDRITIARTDIAEVSRPMRGSIAGGALGAIGGGLLGIYSAVSLGFKQCGDSCSDEGTLMLASLIGMPVAGAWGGAKLFATGRWTVVYRG